MPLVSAAEGRKPLVSIRYFSPAPALRTLLSSYYLFDADLPAVRDIVRAELGQVRLLLRGHGCYTFGDGRSVVCPRLMLSGPTSAPVEFDATGPLTVFGAGLMPAGWAALIGADADELADDVVDFEAVAGRIARHGGERLTAAVSDSARVAAADAMFGALAARAPAPVAFTALADRWLTASANPQVDILVRAAGMSSRQVERLTNRIYGASPKLLARKYRALQAAVRLGSGEADDWAEAASTHFYDQSHFIREFKQFVGMTPVRFMRDAAPVARLTIARRRLLPGIPKLAWFS